MLQSYILSTTTETVVTDDEFGNLVMLQSYILSTTTETPDPAEHCGQNEALQSYILSTTTETKGYSLGERRRKSFNRTSFQQQLKPRSIS